MPFRKEQWLPTPPQIKVLTSVFTFYLTMVVVLKSLASYVHPEIANHAEVFRIQAMVLMPPMMIGIGFMALNVDKLSLKQVFLRSLLASLAGSLIIAIGFPTP